MKNSQAVTKDEGKDSMPGKKLNEVGRKGILAFQHVIAMFGATVLVPAITGLNPAVALFTAGLGTLLFHLVTKGKVPVFLGSSFAFIPVILAVTTRFGDLAYAQGGIMAAGALYLVLSLLISLFGIDKVKSFFPPVVTGPIIIVIGLTLSPVAINMASGNWMVAFISVATVMVFSIFGKGIFKVIPILCGVIVGYIAAIAFGLVDFTQVAEASLFQLPAFTLPKFDIGAIAMTAPIVLAVFMEHIGDITTNGSVVGKDFFKDPGLHRTLMGDGLATMFAGLLGGPPNTTYGENTSVLAVTKNYNPAILRIAAVIAIAMSFIGTIGAILQSIPAPVMGGISLVLFGMISSIGIRTLSEAKIDFTINRNLIIMSLILVAGIGTAFLKGQQDLIMEMVGKGIVIPDEYLNFNTIGIKITENIQLVGLSLAALIGIVANKILPER